MPLLPLACTRSPSPLLSQLMTPTPTHPATARAHPLPRPSSQVKRDVDELRADPDLMSSCELTPAEVDQMLVNYEMELAAARELVSYECVNRRNHYLSCRTIEGKLLLHVEEYRKGKSDATFAFRVEPRTVNVTVLPDDAPSRFTYDIYTAAPGQVIPSPAKPRQAQPSPAKASTPSVA